MATTEADDVEIECQDINSGLTFNKDDQHVIVEGNFNQDISLEDAASTEQTYFTSDGTGVVTIVGSIDSQNIQNVVLSSLPQTDEQLVSNSESQEKMSDTSSYQQSGDAILLQSNHSHVSSAPASPSLCVQETASTSQDIVPSSLAQYNSMNSITLAAIQTVTPSMPSVSMASVNVSMTAKYFCLSTLEEVEEAIRKHTEETFSHFVVAKKTKAYGSQATIIDVKTKFRIHWQSRDLTSTEECAVQIPFDGIPFIYIGEKAYMCHLGRSKASKANRIKKHPSVEVETKRHRSRMTKKQGCPAKIFVKQIAKFPQYRIPHNSEYLRTQMSQKLRKLLLSTEGHLEHIVQYIGTLPEIIEHSNHDIGENTPVREPIDPVIRDKIIELSWEFGEHALPKQIKGRLDSFVEDVLFKDKTPPSKNRRRFYPSEKDITNYIYKSRMISKLSINEQDQLHMLIQKLQQERQADKFSFRIENEDQPTIIIEAGNAQICQPSPETKIIFSYQTHDQQRLLKRYSKQAILTEISRCTVNLPFPIYGVYVPTNVDYQLVYVFITQTKSVQSLKEGLASLVEWNPYWLPKFFVVDFSPYEINAIESVFPSCTIHVSEESRERCWDTWLNDPVNIANLVGDKDDVLQRLSDIANSYTEEALNKAAQNLENSDVWRLSEDLREWFSSEWLSEAKRWVVGYRNDEFFSTLHFDVALADEVSILRDSHYSHLKSKKLSDYIKVLVDDLVPASYQRYVSRNISDYRKQYLAAKKPSEYPSYLENKPWQVANYVLVQSRLAKLEKYTVNQMQPGIFWIPDKDEAEITYVMSFGDATTLPSCVCFDWLKYRLPCKHLTSVFQNFQGWSWDMLSPLYIGNAALNIDFSCFDKYQEDVYLSNLKEEIPSNELGECSGSELSTSQGNSSLVKAVITGSSVAPLPSLNNIVTSGINPTSASPQETSSTTDSTADSFHFVTNLATDCDSFCQELSNTIHRVDNKNVLQKVKLDLQLMLNDVKLEISKVPAVRSTKRASPFEGGALKKVKETHEADGNVSANTSVGLTNFSNVEFVIGEDDWIYDAELNIKLNKRDRKSILEGRPLSLDIIKSVQHVLRHQFGDVLGLYDPDKIDRIPDHVKKQVSQKKSNKVLQVHMGDNKHWSASAKLGENIYIFCCTLNSKPKIIEQILLMTPEDCIGDNILFVERTEKVEDVSCCALYAIAYTVAFAFDIEPRNLIFDEKEMRSHLAECLEDMCFSMFPLKSVSN